MARSVSKMWEKYCLRPTQGTVSTTIPVFIYGTAWKKIAAQIWSTLRSRLDSGLWTLQPNPVITKNISSVMAFAELSPMGSSTGKTYIPVSAQDVGNMPYDPSATVTEQVHASIKSSLHNLRSADDPSSADEAYIDTVVIHSPLPTLAQTLEAWQALETYVPHRIRNLGISNCTMPMLRELCNSSMTTVKPSVVQNRFYEDTLFDVPMRAFCRDNQVIYQGFWTLTANPDLVRSLPVQQLARHVDITPAAAFYALIIGLGNLTVLNGTKDELRMKEDLAAPKKVEEFTQKQPDEWKQILADFQGLTGDSLGL
ncbi:hypothetical protein N7499_001455 [Penicillium canescens]|uniref:NADP-dependent oxidoreductase domain-containing protein n=1 Tax=Penicillium canescens TaxID=5083 RepID=A0AAD6I5L3_PENCN|nr:hypothetical protein N7460_008421 [Penicillium canescens]KAJ6097081.1 hypothetical protein N7499_001455 [Penicillium canescens]KAJ6165070.1 hypothetical protein N7485_008314 [Penicillium canescens]